MAARFVAWVLTHRLRLVRCATVLTSTHYALPSTVPYIFVLSTAVDVVLTLSSIILFLTLCKIEHVLATSTDSSALTLT